MHPRRVTAVTAGERAACGKIATCHMVASNGPSGESTGLSDTPRLTVITQRLSLRFGTMPCYSPP